MKASSHSHLVARNKRAEGEQEEQERGGRAGRPSEGALLRRRRPRATRGRPFSRRPPRALSHTHKRTRLLLHVGEAIRRRNDHRP